MAEEEDKNVCKPIDGNSLAMMASMHEDFCGKSCFLFGECSNKERCAHRDVLACERRFWACRKCKKVMVGDMAKACKSRYYIMNLDTRDMKHLTEVFGLLMQSSTENTEQ
jgi:hypothetical protein